MSEASTPKSLVWWESLHESEGRHYAVVAVGTTRSEALFHAAREIRGPRTPETMLLQSAMARMDLAEMLRAVTTSLERSVVTSLRNEPKTHSALRLTLAEEERR